MTPIHDMQTLDLRNAKTQAARAREELRRKALLDVSQSATSMSNVTSPKQPVLRRTAQRSEQRTAVPSTKLALLRVALIALAVTGAWHVLPSVSASIAYFTDTEAASGLFSAALLEIDAEGGGSETLACGNTTTFLVNTTLTNTRSAHYAVSAENPSGDLALCGLLNIEARLEGERLYPNGGSTNLLDLSVPSATTRGTWEFAVELPLAGQSIPNGAYCTVDIVFRAWCPVTGEYGDGFFDEDRVTITVVKEGCDGPDCEPCTGGGCGDVTVVVENHNEATVINTVEVSANTGGNSANGGSGGAGVGSGGNGGNGGAGGTITTGNSSASVSITNVVNTNNATVDVPGCCDTCACAEDCATPCTAGQTAGPQVESGTEESASTSSDDAAAIRDEAEARIQEALSGLTGLLPRSRR